MDSHTDPETTDHKPQRQDATQWFSLPTEIRLIILKILACENRGLGSYASVCKEWQAVIEKKNFCRLKLQVSCLDYFENMVTRKRDLVRHIWLNIALWKYTCRCCQFGESPSWESRNNTVIRKALQKLFSVLSSWNTSNNDLTLELSTQSPSDSEHWFKDYYWGASTENEDVRLETGNQLQDATTRWHEPEHGWLNGQQVTTPNSSALQRLFESVTCCFLEELPEVHAVTRFMLRRQVRRQFAARVLKLLWNKLPRLDCIAYEPWRLWTGMLRYRYDRKNKILFEECLPMSLKRISVFQDFNEGHIALLQKDFPWQLPAVQIADPALGTAFAYRSLGLEYLSVSYMADARHFFQVVRPTWTWDQLQSLMPTSHLLTYTANRKEISGLLRDAGVAALSMPRLHTLALWNGGKGEACAFIYRKKGNGPSITWRGTWELELCPRTVEAWDEVTTKFHQRKIRVEKQQLCGDIIRSHGDAIYLLELPYEVVDPVSLWQIRREATA